MLHTFVNTTEQTDELHVPLCAEHSNVSERVAARYITMCQHDNVKRRAKFNSTILKDTGDEVFMYTNDKLIMYAMKLDTGPHVEFRFINATAVDRCSGWNHWMQRDFTVVYSNGTPYAIVSGYDSPDDYIHFELSKVKWYSVQELIDICSMNTENTLYA